ncbi:MAG: hypothetical protein ACI4SH_07785 [Candidatus Scatosoma sp.]
MMKNVNKKRMYRSPNLKIWRNGEQDVVRTSNGLEVDYQLQKWGDYTKGFDKPFN